ncbi:biopolymer transporter ExbD [Accumulibacter sp.]|uniref:ExbD/TolR family protein n=1 Tax=Accumulibacter sp. TaxID=2053492 RepID=UPI0028C3F45D|nr:biopolymer transporter ExbD [Accumulibacter sp.]
MASGRFSSTSASAPMCEINTTPLVDVTLVLLIIFVITAPLLTHSVQVELPRATSAPTRTSDAVALQLSIDAAGHLFIGGKTVGLAALETALKQATDGAAGGEVHLHVDRATRYERVAEAMSAARRAGITRIAFHTQPGGQR